MLSNDDVLKWLADDEIAHALARLKPYAAARMHLAD
jgi:hypothetical protein